MFCISDNQPSENEKLYRNLNITFPDSDFEFSEDEVKNNVIDEDRIPFNGHPNDTNSHPKISCKYRFCIYSIRQIYIENSYYYDYSLLLFQILYFRFRSINQE